jgi:hypothetical protein
MKQVRRSQLIFVITFELRVLLIILVARGVWIDLTRDYRLTDLMDIKFLTIMFAFQFIIYNIVPYLTLAYMHYKSFKPDPAQHKSVFSQIIEEESPTMSQRINSVVSSSES